MCHLFIVFLLRIFNSLREKNIYTLPKEKPIGNTQSKEKKILKKLMHLEKVYPFLPSCVVHLSHTLAKICSFISNLGIQDMKFQQLDSNGNRRGDARQLNPN